MSGLLRQPDPIDRALLSLLRLPAAARAGHGLRPADWPILLERARRHHVTPQLLAGLDLEALPPEVRSRVREQRRAFTLRSLLDAEELQRAAAAIRAAGIRPVVVLKGPALDTLAYGGPGLRSAADLDLLVPRVGADEACAALGAAGWRLRDPEQSRRFHRPHHFHDIFVSPRGGLLELHWDLGRATDPFHLSAEAFLARARPADGHQEWLWTSPADLLLHGAAQALLEGYARLLRVCDADRLLRRLGTEIDLEELRGAAQRSGLGPALWLLVELARELLDTPGATWASELAPRGPARLALQALDPARLLLSRQALNHSSLRRLYAVWLAGGPSYRRRAIVALLWPTPAERAWPAAGVWTLPAQLLRRAVTLVKLGGFQALSLVAHAWRRAGGAHAGRDGRAPR